MLLNAQVATRSPDLVERIELQLGWSIGLFALALLGIVLIARRLRRRFSTLAAIALIANLISALAWGFHGWGVYEVPQTRAQTFSACDVFPLVTLTCAAVILLIFTLTESHDKGWR
ncbi:MAG TPA: hypothetical protein VKY89_18360 [Thermoanaerobaculia bacterium]|jgi:hypothetical protein|nr:hypothetical protein [Thermoanaerobaculia bacterium]